MKSNQGVKESAIKTAANACIASCQKLPTQIEQLKRYFVAEFQEALDVPEKLFRLVLNEAEAVAWQTGYPQLVFPALATEKIQAAAGWNARQKFLRQKIPVT